jgi:hypothetical protein
MIAETQRWQCDPARLPRAIGDLENAGEAIRQQLLPCHHPRANR